jgi:tetratricopeptide (TPR) repeat protein
VHIRFSWRFALQGRRVPPDTEEQAAGFYERGEYEKADAIFRLLIDCFPSYAEGHNYLGLIAYEQRHLEQAIEHFEKTAELGRKLFPARIGKKRFWSDHSTRPYMRGLRNLTLALNGAARTLCGRRTAAAKSNDEAEDHNTALTLQWNLHAYLKNQPRAAKTFFQGLVIDPRVAELLDESIAVVRRRQDEHRTGVRSAFDRMQLMRSRPFAVAEASKLRDLLPDRGQRRASVH